MDDGSDIQAYLKTISDQSSVPNIYIGGCHECYYVHHHLLIFNVDGKHIGGIF